LKHQLYINPLNDLGNFLIASHDILNMPTLAFPTKTPPIYLSLYNQMKQEFGSARFFYYDAIMNEKPHFSDIDIVIVDTMEAVFNSLTIEKIKTSFRMSYSIFDKIAFFLNDYLKLGADQLKTSFKTIWYSDSRKKILRNEFANSNNWALRGLYWVSKDLHMT